MNVNVLPSPAPEPSGAGEHNSAGSSVLRPIWGFWAGFSLALRHLHWQEKNHALVQVQIPICLRCFMIPISARLWIQRTAFLYLFKYPDFHNVSLSSDRNFPECAVTSLMLIIQYANFDCSYFNKSVKQINIHFKITVVRCLYFAFKF